MKGSRGFLLVQDVIIFLLCTMLILSTASAWKTCIMWRQRYHEMTEAMQTIESYMASGAFAESENITVSHQVLITGVLKELQVWKDTKREDRLCNLFIVEKRS